MKFIDISQEVLSCNVFPGDESPKAEQVLSVEKGDVCNGQRIFIITATESGQLNI